MRKFIIMSGLSGAVLAGAFGLAEAQTGTGGGGGTGTRSAPTTTTAPATTTTAPARATTAPTTATTVGPNDSDAKGCPPGQYKKPGHGKCEPNARPR